MINNILIITNKSDITSDFIVKELQKRGIDFYRFNTDEITKSVSVSLNFQSKTFAIVDSYSKKSYDLNKFSSVYYRRPELPNIEQNGLSNGEIQFIEHEIIYTLEGVYKILQKAYWVSPLYSIREAENKIHQLIVAQLIGFVIPNSFITNRFEEAKAFFDHNKNQCIIKPIKSGYIEENDKDKVIFTNKIDKLPDQPKSIEVSPVFFQNHIQKKADIRVTVVGNKLFAAKINSQEFDQTITDWRRGEIVLEHERIDLPNDLSIKCIQLLKYLGLKFGAIDFILDLEDNYIFLEINPNGQWAWVEKQTGYEISKEIVNLLLNENF